VAGGRAAGLEVVGGAMRVAEVLLLAAEALGVPAAVAAGLRLDARELRGEDTLVEAGVGASGAEELWVRVLVAGGMPTEEENGLVGALDELHLQVSDFVLVLDLTVQQERAASSLVHPVTAEVMLLIACHCTSLTFFASDQCTLSRLA
jgi:hypothetical protein